jgi:hypothetical protein
MALVIIACCLSGYLLAQPLIAMWREIQGKKRPMIGGR